MRETRQVAATDHRKKDSTTTTATTTTTTSACWCRAGDDEMPRELPQLRAQLLCEVLQQRDELLFLDKAAAVDVELGQVLSALFQRIIEAWERR